MKKRLIVFSFLLLSFGTIAQSFTFERWETDGALEGFGTFSTSMIDSSGSLWVGGNSAAIAKYENEEWEVYDLDLLFGISSFTRISDLHMDSENILWAISDKGIFKLDDGEWIYYKDELEKSFGYTIAEKQDTMYFSTRGGLMTLVNTTWGYMAIQGNQPGYVTVDGAGYVWVSFSNGDGNYKYVDGIWQNISTDNSGICTRFAVDNETSPNGDMWIIGASGAMCNYDGENFRDYKLDGGVIGILNTIAFSPEGNHVFIGGDEFGQDRSIKHFFEEELVSTYGSANGLADAEVFSIAVESESSAYVFFADEIYRGSLSSSVAKVKVEDDILISNLVSEELVFTARSDVRGFIFNANGQFVRTILTENGRADVSELQPGIYFLKLKAQYSSAAEKFVKL